MANELLLNEKEATHLENLLIAIGNLTYNNFDNRSIAKDIDLPSNLHDLKIQGEEDNVARLRNYLISIIK